jgi:adenine-specific DNA-methyltransferase
MAQNATGRGFSPQNPHPLSTLRTELVWEGKYDEYGNRREVDIAGLGDSRVRGQQGQRKRRSKPARSSG